MEKKNELVIASNRLPLQICEGKIIPSDGGLVSAIKEARIDQKITWVGQLGLTQAQQRHNLLQNQHPNFEYIDLNLDQELYNKYYNGYCNQVLWPSFHDRIDLINFKSSDWRAYQKANLHFCDKILKETSVQTPVWLQDYHLLLAPEIIKAIQPQRKVSFFLHIPWPKISVAKQIPHLTQIALSLSQADVIAFHTEEYAENFNDFLEELSQKGIISTEVHKLTQKVFCHPIGIAPENFQNKMSSLEQKNDIQTMIGVDRFDYSKGIDFKFRLINQLLEQYPQLRKNIVLKQLLIPTRQNIPAYQNYRNKVLNLAHQINKRYQTPSWKPIELTEGRMKRDELIDFYQKGDICLVTSYRDGMNLVTLEYLAAQPPKNPGQVLISRRTGVSNFLDSQVKLNPDQISVSVNRIYEALRTSRDNRIMKWKKAMKWIKSNTSKDWALNNLESLQYLGSKDNSDFKEAQATL